MYCYENSLKNNNIVRTESIINSNQQLSSGNSSAGFDSLWEDEPAQSTSDSTAFNDSSANNSVATSSEAETVSSNPKQSSEQNIDVGVGNDFETTQIFVLNTNTKKFHKSSCGQVKRISPENYSTADNRENTINSGYVPCKKCDP